MWRSCTTAHTSRRTAATARRSVISLSSSKATTCQRLVPVRDERDQLTPPTTPRARLVPPVLGLHGLDGKARRQRPLTVDGGRVVAATDGPVGAADPNGFRGAPGRRLVAAGTDGAAGPERDQTSGSSVCVRKRARSPSFSRRLKSAYNLQFRPGSSSLLLDKTAVPTPIQYDSKHATSGSTTRAGRHVSRVGIPNYSHHPHTAHKHGVRGYGPS